MSTTSYTLENALSLARNLIYGPLPKPDDPTPTIAEALKAVEAALLTHKFNWLTGQAARDALRGATEQGTPLILK